MKEDAIAKVYAQAVVHESFPEFVDFAKDQGCNLEVATFAYSNVFDADWQKLLQGHKQKMSSFGGKTSFHGVFQDVLVHSSDKKIAELSKERVTSSLKVASELKAIQVVFHGNFNPLVKDEYYNKNWVERNSSFWSEILDMYHIKILLENTWEPTPDTFRRLLDQINSPLFKICFDIGHAKVYSKAPVREWFVSLGSDIPYIHVSDNSGEKDQHSEIGKGKINWQEFSNLVEEYAVHPEIVLELVRLDETKRSLKYLNENGIYPFNNGA
ncbi:MAG TPA: sugar phosphate isomerase/epimerase family protein [Candidatus Limnocylindrales bacterium]|nr:sugar phosphate isomerase/epimerase family protein [Candidatus Limnocylindrales bacterium]